VTAEQRIVIIPGTGRMVETTWLLGAADLGKTFVLTGAMVPYAVIGSDSLFNLGISMAAAQLLPAGAYMGMNGRTFPWNNVRKNREPGLFVPQVEENR
jgi:L-asparaginase